MSELKIKIEIEKIDEIINGISLLSLALAHANGMENLEKIIEEQREDKENKKEYTENIKEEESVKLESKVKPTATLEDIRSIIVALAKQSDSKKDAAIEVIHEYGAASVSDIKEEDYDKVIKDLRRLA